jgi:hypothetical protein
MCGSAVGRGSTFTPCIPCISCISCIYTWGISRNLVGLAYTIYVYTWGLEQYWNIHGVTYICTSHILVRSVYYTLCISRVYCVYPMYIPCRPCIFFDSEMSFATDFTFTKAIDSSCPGLFPAMQDVFIVIWLESQSWQSVSDKNECNLVSSARGFNVNNTRNDVIV